jgi:hypothetical protein
MMMFGIYCALSFIAVPGTYSFSGLLRLCVDRLICCSVYVTALAHYPEHEEYIVVRKEVMFGSVAENYNKSL